VSVAWKTNGRQTGKSSNLAPFSYFNVINHDPPLFIFGFAGGFDRPKDTLRNLIDTKECMISHTSSKAHIDPSLGCVNIISEHYVEAANACSINAPHGVSEWTLSGLHPAPCKSVKPNRAREAIFSIEAKLVETREFESRATPGKKTGVLAVVEGVRFWVRDDAINEGGDFVDPAVRIALAF
jgi:flavin reductase (DIM6/NTAB) family NADH-FMN oxidoreductase RutF